MDQRQGEGLRYLEHYGNHVSRRAIQKNQQKRRWLFQRNFKRRERQPSIEI